MTAIQITLVLISLVTFAGGQLLFKLSVEDSGSARQIPKSRRAWIFAAGILSMTISFFLTLGLLQKLELSRVFPFQGLSVIIITVCASVFLKERLTLPVVIGALLVTAGVILVSSS